MYLSQGAPGRENAENARCWMHISAFAHWTGVAAISGTALLAPHSVCWMDGDERVEG